MRKTIARGLILAVGLTGLIATAPTPNATAHHVGGHHCRWRPHIHAKKPGRHPHHLHQCRLRPTFVYPPS